jgi:hypothetical protein
MIPVYNKNNTYELFLHENNKWSELTKFLPFSKEVPEGGWIINIFPL